MTSRPSRHILTASAIALMLVVGLAQAASVRWYLHNVTFTDGATAQGFFDIDPTTGLLGNFAITTTDGPQISGHTYTNATAFGNRYDSAGVPGTVISNTFALNGNGWTIKLTPVEDLDASGGSHALLINVNASVECDNCSPSRNITAGSLEGVTDVIFADGFGG